MIPTANLSPSATSTATVGLNLNSGSTVPTAGTFSPTDPTSFNNSTSMTVYDSLGNSHVVTMYFALASSATTPPALASTTASSTWNTYLTVDGTAVPGTPAPALGQLGFNASGTMVYPPAGTLKLGQLNATVPTSVTPGANQLSMVLDFSTTTQYGASFGVNQLSQNGYTSGQLSGFNTGPSGIIQGTYSNGQSKNLGQIVLANFADPQGLQSQGNNQWSESTASGAALVGAPATGSLGVIQSGATEASNVDLTAELVNLITAQRNYQANAQTIKTEDQIQQTLVNLR